ncbi:unnamed protein product [Cuscuta epithymum]|uniref:Uncharacterized protein n=1 Tax=Cuscuta epithymum TaxID=186058 RepID=A0AAV0F2F2_9ASTE|nr:unnamed protein product [Cuscuta epithymum]
MGVILGPPEVYKPPATAAGSESSGSDSDSFMDGMEKDFNHSDRDSDSPPMGLTQNNSLTYLSTKNPCLDFFYQIVPGTPRLTIHESLRRSWDHNPLTTLKLICNLRGLRGTGKSDREGYYASALWLHGLHPKTLACNLREMAKFGYFKDFPELLYRLMEGEEVRKIRKIRHERNKSRMKRKRRRYVAPDEKKKQPLTEAQREARILANQAKHMAEKAAASRARESAKAEKAKKAILRYKHDPDYRYLHDSISDLFAEFLKKDLESLNQTGSPVISLAAKWCPSLNSPFERSTLLCESIARKIFPKEQHPEYQTLEESQYAYRVRDRLRKEVLVPLRKALQLPEVYMGAQNWGSVPYNRVPSIAMKAYEKTFLKHDKDRFEEYLNDVKSGNAKIAAGVLLPHEIIKSLGEDGTGSSVAEAQWRRMVDDLTKRGKLKNCLAVCDVSCSGLSMVQGDVSLAMGLLVSELSEEPWKGRLITFSTKPKLHKIKGDTLLSKVDSVKKMKSGTRPDFQRVFDAILEVAVKGNLSEDQMIKRLFVFSGMDFKHALSMRDESSDEEGDDVFKVRMRMRRMMGRPRMMDWETDYEAIERKFKEKGYGNCIPEMVFWNLSDSKSTPVVGNQKGVALVSGHAKNMLKTFLEGDGVIDPLTIMESAISREEYSNLAVFD